MKPTTIEKPTRLPEWEACLDAMRAAGVAFGSKFDRHFFEKHLCVKWGDLRFSLRISKIRKALELDGFYLSGRGGNGQFWVILPPAENSRVMINYGRAAVSALARGVILGTNTRLDTLEPEERKRHEAILERIAKKAALMTRDGAFLRELGMDDRKAGTVSRLQS